MSLAIAVPANDAPRLPSQQLPLRVQSDIRLGATPVGNMHAAVTRIKGGDATDACHAACTAAGAREGDVVLHVTHVFLEPEVTLRAISLLRCC